EASLVLAQKWAERKRRLLLVVPAALRQQWAQELTEKFSLPTWILEARNVNMVQASDNAFERDGIVILSYEFAARRQEELSRVRWDLAVFDEAHKLRNFHKEESAKIASKLDAALRECPKLLLSATPLQNNLLELYGLVAFIDPHFFGSLDAFKTRYCRPRLEASEFERLRARLKPICRRTLRRQVQESGGIKFTRRFSMTEDFRPSDDELSLYAQVSAYLQGDDLLAIKPGARHLVTLVIRKILASSSFAIQGTLSTMIARLEKRLPLDEPALADYDAIDDLADEEGIETEELGEAQTETANLSEEIDKLKSFRALAECITRNAKADALLRVLGRAFDLAERLGGQRKAVIFTESVRTQSWLKDLLTGRGHDGRLAVLNGSNADPDSQRIYRDWLEKHKGTGRVSGVKTADMKAALVEHFRDAAEILICTEAGAEGINLQFCSLLINYDLPWNPQRVEQRIGRVHRYGQKHDVVVVNFINKGNRADERVFELLNQKFRLFEGVFGASDEILGSIESGVDIERRIHDIYQKCRNDAQIDEEFNRLQETLKDELNVRTRETQRSLLENFDADVVKRLKLTRDKTEGRLSAYQEQMLLLARMMLPAARFDGFTLEYEGHLYDTRWQEADAANKRFLRPSEGLGAELIEKAKNGLEDLPIAELVFDLAHTQSGQHSWLQNLENRAGDLIVEKLSFTTARHTVEHLLIAAISDGGEEFDQDAAERLLTLPATIAREPIALRAPKLLETQLAAQHADRQQEAEKLNERYFMEESEKLEAWAEDRRIALDIRIKQLDREIRDARRAIRQLPTLAEKLEGKRALKQQEQERDALMLDYHEEKKRIEAEEDRLLEKIEAALAVTPHRQRLFAIRWRLKG
ncbi:MAG: DEAD/DEAH box helicase, partial [Zoogloeaceae bacterium]|nr:DEAD/DEAH box helicase [Zoogloeaceae bacterium]